MSGDVCAYMENANSPTLSRCTTKVMIGKRTWTNIMQDSQRRINIDNTTMTKLNFVTLRSCCQFRFSRQREKRCFNVQSVPYKRHVYRLVVGICVQNRRWVAVETIHVAVMPQLVAIGIGIGNTSECERGDGEKRFDGEHDEDDLEHRPPPSFDSKSELRELHGAGAVDVVSFC